MALSKEILAKVEQHALGQLGLRNDLSSKRTNLYLQTNSVDKDQELTLGLNQSVTVSRESALVFIDHAPLYNWGHPCEFILYDATNGEEYEKHASQLPPASFYHTPEQYKTLQAPVSFPAPEIIAPVEPTKIPQLDNALANASGKKYALLFSGMSNNRHLNDLEFLYRTLLDIYKFNAADITVLNYDGKVNYAGSPQPVKNWPGNNTPYRIKVNGAGTNTALSQALDTVKAKLHPNDLLLIHTNNHGGGPTDDPEAWLCCYPNWESFTASQFANKVKELPAVGSLVVMMEQCHSGGFQDAVINNSKAASTSFAAACLATASSMGGADFDPFAKDWIAGVTGKNPNGSALSKPVPQPASAADAFNYANAVKVAGDSPVYADKPANCGKTQTLAGVQLMTFKNTVASCNSDGRLEVFSIKTDGSVADIWQTAPNNGWSALTDMGGVVKQLVAALNLDGRLEIFGIGTDNAAWHNYQTAPHSGPWSGWKSMGGSVKQLSVARNKDGRLELFAIGSNNALWHIWQTAPNNGWSAWTSLSGGIKELKAGSNADGRLEVFAVGTNNALWHIWQTAPGNGWSGWSSLGGFIRGIDLASNADGRLEVFAIGSNNACWHIYQTKPNNGWGGWASLGGVIKQLTSERNKDGRLEVFAIGSDNALWHIWQTAPNNGWSAWGSLGGIITQVSSDRNADGRIEVFAIGSDAGVWHIWQTAPNNGWSGWGKLA